MSDLPSGWQPIETAPKDGRQLLLWLADEGFWEQASWRIFEGEGCWWLWAMDCSADWHEPTHWMRPDPPHS